MVTWDLPWSYFLTAYRGYGIWNPDTPLTRNANNFNVGILFCPTQYAKLLVLGFYHRYRSEKTWNVRIWEVKGNMFFPGADVNSPLQMRFCGGGIGSNVYHSSGQYMYLRLRRKTNVLSSSSFESEYRTMNEYEKNDINSKFNSIFHSFTTDHSCISIQYNQNFPWHHLHDVKTHLKCCLIWYVLTESCWWTHASFVICILCQYVHMNDIELEFRRQKGERVCTASLLLTSTVYLSSSTPMW